MASLLADFVVLVHAAFVVFVIVGGVLVWRWPRLAWLHVPCALWGAAVEFAGWVCPLTPLENQLRVRAGEVAYGGDFAGRYVMPVLYPEGLTRGWQFALGAVVVGVNGVVYWRLWRARPRTGPCGPKVESR
jgi:hypothetical protein